MNILITGASGYLGGRLINHLSQNTAHKIVAASRNKPPIESTVQSVLIDWQDNDSIFALCQDMAVIIHLASMTEQESETDYQNALLDNGMSSLKLLEAAKKAGVRRFIYMSSIKVFGNQPCGSLDENSLARPQSSYGITHKLVEDYLMAANSKKLIEGLVLRLSNAVGTPINPKEHTWRLVGNDFCRQAVMTQKIVLNSSGSSWRNFISISDIAKAFDTLIQTPPINFGNGLFNLGGSNSMRIIDLAKIVAARAELSLGTTIELKYPEEISSKEMQFLNWRTDKLRKLGWQSNDSSTIDEIDKTIEFCLTLSG